MKSPSQKRRRGLRRHDNEKKDAHARKRARRRKKSDGQQKVSQNFRKWLSAKKKLAKSYEKGDSQDVSYWEWFVEKLAVNIKEI